MISRYETNQENQPSYDEAAWCAAIEGVTKGGIYGVPGMPKFMVSTSVSSQSYTMESTSPSSSIQVLKKANKKRDDHILSLQQEMTSIKNLLVTWDTKHIHQIWTKVSRCLWLHLFRHMWLHR